MKQTIVTVFIVFIITSAAQAQMRITEWMYNGKMTGSQWANSSNSPTSGLRPST